MKLLIVLCLVTAALARPDKSAIIVSSLNELRADNSYDFQFETSRGLTRQESGVWTPGQLPETGTLVQRGSYQFRHPDGTITSIRFTADEDGYRPQGNVLPTVPAPGPVM